MIALRVIGWMLVVIALALLVREAYFWLTTGSWDLLPAGELWFNIHKNSLLLVQPAIERHLWPPLWRPIETLLTWPAWAVIGVPGLLLALVRMRWRTGARRRYFK